MSSDIDVLEGLDFELSLPEWMQSMSSTCPCCQSQMALKPGLTNPNVGKAECSKCGFRANFTAPIEMLDRRWIEDASL